MAPRTGKKSNSDSAVDKALGFKLKNLSSWNSFVRILFKPVDPSSLAISRILFGALMLLDIPDERGLGDADLRWGDPDECRFPLFDFLKPLSLPWMCIVYLTMWLGAAGIMLGAFYRLSCFAFLIPYWYIFLLDKTVWNNHSYLYGLLSIIFAFTDSNSYCSMDVYTGRTKHKDVPLWNYGILRFQLFLLYFYAGLKKFNFDWLSGQSMTELSNHWVFDPFRIFLSSHEIDLWIVHVSGFLLDLTIGFWIYFDKTRPIAFVFLASFHLMNSQMFYIGMFPYVCLVTMPLFCAFDWPKKLIGKFRSTPEKNKDCYYETDRKSKNDEEVHGWKKNTLAVALCAHVFAQCFLPYSHFITKGYNNWTNGLYGYSWDMMVNTWDPVMAMIKVVDNETGKEMFLDPEAWVRNDRWQKHGDMVFQYSKCVKKHLENSKSGLKNFSIYIDVWTSLNKRFQQRMFNPKVDLLKAEWSPVKPISWLMPLLSDLTSWRHALVQIGKDVQSWSNYSDALFIADFPGLFLENYIHPDLTNVTLTVLKGEVVLEKSNGTNVTLSPGENEHLDTGDFHKIHTVSETPACYMYTFYNMTHNEIRQKKHFDLGNFHKYLNDRFDGMIRSVALVSNAILNLLYSVPMIRRVEIRE